MKHLLTILILVTAISGCIMDNPPDPYEFKQDNGGLGRWCRTTLVAVDTYVDSTSTCGDGSSPRLAKVEWLSTNGTCYAGKPSDVLGGFTGIRRYFACIKNEPIMEGTF